MGRSPPPPATEHPSPFPLPTISPPERHQHIRGHSFTQLLHSRLECGNVHDKRLLLLLCTLIIAPATRRTRVRGIALIVHLQEQGASPTTSVPKESLVFRTLKTLSSTYRLREHRRIATIASVASRIIVESQCDGNWQRASAIDHQLSAERTFSVDVQQSSSREGRHRQPGHLY